MKIVRNFFTDNNNIFIFVVKQTKQVMLIKFAVKNYRGFAQRIEWDLSKPSNYAFNDYAIQDGIVKNGIIYGPNGSGKTNFSLALFDLENHLSQKMKKPDYYVNFVNAANSNLPVEFEYTFKFGTQILQYNYSKNSRGLLLTENLQIDGEEIFNRTQEHFYISSHLFPMNEDVQRSFIKSTNNVSVVNFLVSTFPLDKEHYLLQLYQFVDSMLWFRCLDTREFIGLDTTVTQVEEYIIKNNLLSDFSTFLETISGQKFDMIPDPSSNVILCKYDQTVIPFVLIASTGTQSLELLYFWLQKISHTSFVFIDEFDAFYHFRLSFEVCKRLFKMHGQAFVSSHNTYLMTNELLRPDCNFILNYNKVKPLNDCTDKELRFGHNMEKLFRGNAFKI